MHPLLSPTPVPKVVLTLYNMDLSSLNTACSSGSLPFIRQFLSEFWLPPSHLDQIDSQTGWTPLIRAVICGHGNVVKCLLEFGVSPNRKSGAGETPLLIAVESGWEAVAKELLEHGADPNATNEYGETPLHLAVSRDNPSLLSLLLRFKADPTIKSPLSSHTPESQAISEHKVRLIPLFGKGEVLDFRSPAKPPTRPSIGSKSPSLVSSRRSTAIAPPTPRSNRSRSTSGERTALEQLADMQELNLNILAALSTYDSEKTLPSESTLKSPPPLPPPPKPPLPFDKSALSPSQACLDRWLSGLQLSHLLPLLIQAGFHSIETLLSMQATLSLERLASDGIVLPGEGLTLLAALELEEKYRGRGEGCLYSCCGEYMQPQSLDSVASLYDWLRDLGLEDEFDQFYYAGFKSLEPLLALMHTKWALSDESLSSLIKIEKLGHRHRILSQLVSEAREIDPYTVLLGVSGLQTTQNRQKSCDVM